jgi:hypothetical protein
MIDNNLSIEGTTIFDFGFSKKYNLSRPPIEGRVLDRCQAFDRLIRVDTHLCMYACKHPLPEKNVLVCLLRLSERYESFPLVSLFQLSRQDADQGGSSSPAASVRRHTRILIGSLQSDDLLSFSRPQMRLNHIIVEHFTSILVLAV